eukprot:2643850-Heterocapsa_arctica.AAC.1
MASGKADPPPAELIENMKNKQRIAELEGLLCRPRAEQTAVSTTPVLASEADSGDTSFATPRGSAMPATAAHRE